MINFWPLLLPVAAFSGWYVAQCLGGKTVHKPSKEYFIGLNYLLNEQPDKAVDIFIKLLEVDDETVEMHLALGSLFRRRGETDRAIRIHQNLIARSQISPHQRIDALVALGQDFMAAGFFDRAEKIFEEVCLNERSNVLQQENCLKYLIDLYQREKAWKKCIELSEKLENITGKPLNQKVAHYYCECAELAMDKKEEKVADDYLIKAFQANKNSARACLLLGHLRKEQGHYKEAIKAYKKVGKKEPDYLCEIVDSLIFCYQKLDKEEECVAYFQETMKQHPRVSLLLYLADFIKKNQSREQALDFAADHLGQYPSVKGINQLIAWYLETTSGKIRSKLQMLYDITNNLLKDKPIYRCVQCGYSGKFLYWLCPSCREWDVIKPVHGLEGD